MEAIDKKLKVGVVGLGKMGLLHASILNVMPNVELAALCDKSWIMRKLAKSTLKQVTVTDEIDKMSSLDLDVIYVTTPIPSHYSIAKEIFSESIAQNVFIEKTLSSRYNQSDELCNLAENFGFNMVGYMKRFSVTFRKAKELCDQGILGSLLYFDAYAYSSDFFGVTNDETSGSRGGVLEDLGSHVVDLALWYFGDLLCPIKVSSSTPLKSETIQFEVTGLNGFIGKFRVSWVQKDYRMPEFGLTIHGTEGTIDVTDNAVVLALNKAEPKTFYRQDLNDYVGFYLGDSEYFREDSHFIKSIITNSKPEPSFKTAKQVDYLLDQVRLSSK